MKKILLFANDPGGINTVVPLAAPLKKKGYRVSLKLKDEKFQLADLKIKPDFIITGTSANDFSERYLWKEAEKFAIPAFAILDQWMNYGIRFSSYGVCEIKKYQKKPNHDYMPTKILVMDDLAKKEMIRDGIPPHKILISGQPYFEFIRNKKIQKVKIKKTLGILPSDFVVTFASEPLIKTYQQTIESRKPYGYNEISIFKHLYRALNKIADSYSQKIKLIIKLHPKEDECYYSKILPGLSQSKIEIMIDKNSDPQGLISVSDLVCGMSSTFLLEALLLKKPTLSILIGLKGKNLFVLDRIKVLKSCLNERELQQKISDVIIKKQPATKLTFKLIENPIERVIKYMEQYQCQN